MRLKRLLYLFVIHFWNCFPFRKQLAFLFKRAHLSVGKLWCDLWFQGIFPVEFLGRTFLLESTRDDKGTLEIFWKGLDKSWDASSLKIWAELAKTASIVLDIGANIGLYSIAAKTVNPDCAVYAFEPSRKSLEKLRKNIAINKLDILVVPIAISNTNGELDFYDLNTFTATSSLKPNYNIIGSPTSITYKVPVTTLMAYSTKNQINHIDLISIDTEMSEPEILDGMADLIRKFRPNFIIEVLNNEVGSRIENYFLCLDYLYFAIDEELGPQRTQHIARESKHDHSSKSFNFLICTLSAAQSLGLDN